MKAQLLLIISSFLLFTSFNSIDKSSIENDVNTTLYENSHLVFDGHEGDYYIFSDCDYKAHWFEVNEQSNLAEYDFELEEYVGNSFKVTYALKTDGTKNSMGYIIDLEIEETE